MSRHSAVRTQLQGRLDQLLRRVRKIEGDLRSTHDPDWVERASELENDEVLEGLDEIGRAEVRQLREALSRIDRESYGICRDCGQPITEKRLTAVPSAVTCVHCAA